MEGRTKKEERKAMERKMETTKRKLVKAKESWIQRHGQPQPHRTPWHQFVHQHSHPDTKEFLMLSNPALHVFYNYFTAIQEATNWKENKVKNKTVLSTYACGFLASGEQVFFGLCIPLHPASVTCWKGQKALRSVVQGQQAHAACIIRSHQRTLITTDSSKI